MASGDIGQDTLLDASACAEGHLRGLVEGMRRREVRALERIYEASVDRLHTLVARICPDPRDTEEVLADTFQYAWEHADDFDSARGNVMAWLSMLAWSRASDRRRRAKPMQSIETLHPAGVEVAYGDCEEDVTSDELESFVDGHRLKLALSRLGVEQRRLILMAFFEGASHAEIAERTGMPLGTVKSHIRRGMTALRDQLEGGRIHG
ncbi:MAG: sigma-70 family RNA polymerase sigma factor [Xanthomonadales bacterium PRO6]|nr:sigma-70 family RNA polymerase sigma factor [Xanthomonadales bacterium PRO6]